jgi:hypothetical protein
MTDQTDDKTDEQEQGGSGGRDAGQSGASKPRDVSQEGRQIAQDPEQTTGQGGMS